MIVKAEDMIRDVRVAIDMNRGDAPLIEEGDIDSLSLNDIIYSKLTEGVMLVEQEAPQALLESGHDLRGFAEAEGMNNISEDGIFWGEDGAGWILLPQDFMRLINFRMSDWRQGVHETITESDPKYSLQSSRCMGIRGNYEKPVVAIVRHSEGLVLEFYSCLSEDATIAQGSYIPYPKIDKDGGIDIARLCYRAVVYRVASLVLATIGDTMATTLLEISRSMIGVRK